MIFVTYDLFIMIFSFSKFQLLWAVNLEIN